MLKIWGHNLIQMVDLGGAYLFVIGKKNVARQLLKFIQTLYMPNQYGRSEDYIVLALWTKTAVWFNRKRMHWNQFIFFQKLCNRTI